MRFVLTQILSFVVLIFLCNPIFSQSNKCNIIYNGIDLQTKVKRIEVEPKLIFNHTPRAIKNALQEDNLINCMGQVVQIDGKTYLHLNIRINSLLAVDQYGAIETNALLKIVLLNGKELEVKCYAGSPGVRHEEGFYIYPVGYSLTSRMVNQLESKEIDKIGIQWTSGYEEYVIYEVDFMQNQIRCLKQALQKPN